MEISSPNNERYQYWLKLIEPRGLKKSKHFLLSGKKLLAEFADEKWVKIESVIAHHKHHIEELPLTLQDKPSFTLPKELFAKLDVIGTDYPIVLCEQPEFCHWQETDSPLGLELFLPVGDPLNLGSIARSAEAFGISKLILLEEACHPLHPKALKASSGSLLRLPIFWGPSIKELSTHLIALDMKGQSIAQFKWPKHSRLLIGEEGPGLPGNLKITPISIPMQGNIESLNASISASIAMYLYSQLHSQQK